MDDKRTDEENSKRFRNRKMKFVLRRKKHFSQSGFLAELVSSKYRDEPFKIHSYLVKINANFTRAEHYHKSKKEWITPLFGKALLKMKNIKTKRRKKYLLDARNREQKIIYIPPYWAHSIKAVNSDSGILVFSLTPENKQDTIPYKI